MTVSPHATVAPTDDLFRVLFVCTGNVCRSPTAERLLTRLSSDALDITSAGTHAMSGRSIAEPMAALLKGSGADSREFVARQLTQELVTDANLVLAMTQEHRSAVVQLVPRAVRRTFTFVEFARLLKGVQPGQFGTGSVPQRWAAAVPLAAAQRGAVPAVGSDDVADPYRSSEAVYRTAFDQIYSVARDISAMMHT